MKRLHLIDQQVVVWKSSIFQTTTTLIDAGDAVLLVDPNWLPDEIEEVRQWIRTFHHSKDLFLLITHSDYDHIIGSGAFPEAKIITSKGVNEHADKEKKLLEIAEFDAKNYILRNYPITYPLADIVIHDDGCAMSIGQMDVMFYFAPGHVSDSIFCLIPVLPHPFEGISRGLWIAGDYFSDIEIPWIDDNLQSYLHTVENAIEKVNKYDTIDLLIPGHGNPAYGRDEILQRMYKDKEYLSRLQVITTKNIALPIQNEFTALFGSYPFPAQMLDIHMHNLNKIGRNRCSTTGI